MTMILGLNLSDRVYLAADTRVTMSNGTHEDHVLKIMPLVESPSLEPCEMPNSINLAVAGDVRFSTYFYEQIYALIKSGGLSSDIRILSKQLDQARIETLLGDWVSRYTNPFGRRCCLLFAGQSIERSKILPRAKLDDLLRIYSEEQEKGRANRHQIVEALEKDATMKIIDAKMKAEAGRGVLESLEISSIPKMPEHIEEAAQDINGKSSKRDSFIFCLEIAITQGGVSLRREEAEWGQLISRGTAGISSGDVPSSLLATIELMPGKDKNLEHMVEGAMMSATIMDLAKERGITGIGGQVIITSIKDGRNQIMGSGNAVKFTPSGMLINANGGFRQIVPFVKYLAKNSRAEASLLIDQMAS